MNEFEKKEITIEVEGKEIDVMLENLASEEGAIGKIFNSDEIEELDHVQQ